MDVPELFYKTLEKLDENEFPLKTFFLFSMKLDSDLCQYTHRAVAKNTTLTYLEMQNLECSYPALLVSSLACNQTISTVVLEKICQPQFVEEIANVLLQNRVITQLKISFSLVSSAASKSLGDALAVNDTLRYLELNHVDFRSINAVHFFDRLAENGALQSLVLPWNHMGEGQTTGQRMSDAVSRLITRTSTLRALDLTLNHFSDDHCRAIFAALAHNTSLTSLNASQNRLGPLSAGALVDALASRNSTLTHLVIDDNPLAQRECALLARGLPRMLGLQALSFLNKEPLACVDDLVSAALDHPRLRSFKTTLHHFDAALVRDALIQKLPFHTALRELELQTDGLPIGGTLQLEDALRRSNSTLQKLKLAKVKEMYITYRNKQNKKMKKIWLYDLLVNAASRFRWFDY